MKYDKLTTELRNQKTMHIDSMSTIDMLRAINEEDISVPLAVQGQIEHIAKAVEAAAHAFENGGRLIYVGAGTSGRLGVLDASECPPTYGVSPDLVVGVIAGGDYALRHAAEGAEDDAAQGALDLQALQICENDVVVGISAAGGAAYVISALQTSKEQNATTVALTCNPGSPLANCADIEIAVVVGAEAVTGSTRMKAGTAQKLVLNMISTGAMIRTGKVYENLMVNMRPTNKKLRDRAARIIGQLTQADEQHALEALDDCDGDIRSAVDKIKAVK